MVSLNDLLNAPLNRKLGRIDDHEIIHLEKAAANMDHIVNPANKGHKLYAADILSLVLKAKEYNLWDDWKHKVSEALPYNPYVKPNIVGTRFKTDHLDRDVYEHLLLSTQFPILVPEDNKTFVNLDNKCFSLNNFLFELSDEMVEHLRQGKKFWIYSNDGRVAWYTRAEVEAQNKWKSAELVYKQKILHLFELSNEILNAKPIFEAFEQKRKFENLPFSWYTGIKTVLCGLSQTSWGDGAKSNTVNHLVVNEDFTSGHLARSANSFLCSAGGFGSVEESKKEYTVKVAGFVVDKVPHKITCKACLKRVQRFLNKNDES